MAYVFTAFQGKMEESSVCETATGDSSAIPHMPSLSLCHGSLTLGENEHSKRFPPPYYFSPLFYFISLVLFPPSLALLPQFFIILWGGWHFNSTTSPLWLWINVHHAETGKDRKYISRALNSVSLDFCEAAEWQNMWACSLMCLISRHGLK